MHVCRLRPPTPNALPSSAIPAGCTPRQPGAPGPAGSLAARCPSPPSSSPAPAMEPSPSRRFARPSAPSSLRPALCARLSSSSSLRRAMWPSSLRPALYAQLSAASSLRPARRPSHAAQPGSRARQPHHSVAVVHCYDQLLEEPPRLCLGQPPPRCDKAEQVPARRILHGQDLGRQRPRGRGWRRGTGRRAGLSGGAGWATLLLHVARCHAAAPAALRCRRRAQHAGVRRP